MAKSKKTDHSADDNLEVVDLIALLTMPGYDGLYEAEIIAPDEEFDLLAFAPEEPAEAASPPTPRETPPTVPPRPAPPPAPTRLRSLPTAPAATPAATPPTARPAPPATAAPLPGPSQAGLARLQPVPEVADDSLDKIAAEIAACEKCGLCKTRKNTVPGVGNPKARLVLVGEAPGADEDAKGIPFIGPAGQHLDKIINAAGFKRDEIFICNIIKCRPPENRDPALAEMVACAPFLQRQLRLLNPRLIACLGNVAIKFVIGPDSTGITRIHGQWFTSIFGIPTMAMYHPSYLLRNPSREKGSPNWQMWQDIQALKKRHDEL